MRRILPVLMVTGLVVGVSACASSTTGVSTTQSSSGGPTTTSVAGVSTTTSEAATTLDAMRLTVGDVGSDWEVGPTLNSADLTAITQMPCENAGINPTIAARLTAATGVQFEPVDRSYRHLIETMITGDANRLDRDLAILFGAIDACNGVAAATSTDVTTSVAPTSSAAAVPTSVLSSGLSISPFVLPTLGDQREGRLLVAAEEPGSQLTWYVRTAAVRVGGVAVVLSLTEILNSPTDTPSISDAQFVALLTTAVGKVH